MNDFYKALARKGQMHSPGCPKQNNAVTDAAAAGHKGKEGFVPTKFPIVPEKAVIHCLVTVGFYFLIVKYSTPPSMLQSSIS